MVVTNTITGAARRHAISPATLLGVMCLVFIAAISIAALAKYAGDVTGIWVANAVLLAVILKHHRRDWAAIALAGFVANVAADLFTYDASISLFSAALNCLEVFVVAFPLRLFWLDRDFTRPSTLLCFYALAAGPAPILSASLCGAVFHLTNGAPLISSAINWYSADALGLIIVVPPLMTVRLEAIKAMFGRDQLLWTCALLGIVVATIALNYFARSYPIAFLFFPAVLLLTFQRGFAGGMMGLLLSALYLLLPAVIGQSAGPLHIHTIREQTIVVQVFIAVMGFSVVLVGAALEERRRLERGLAKAIARAENSREEAMVAKESAEEATRTKSMFLATMSHELRTPLNAVIGFAEMMHTEMFGPLGDAHYREYTGVIRDAGRHLLDLINDILDMSKIEAGKHEIDHEKLNLCDIIRDGLTLMAEKAASGAIELSSDVPPASLLVDGDRRAMKQILLNLLSNAIKFTPHGGHVTARAQRSGSQIVLSVSDTGVGIPADQIYRLGNPFVQIRNSAGTSQNGTGLGLALVRSLAEMQGGTLKIESTEGRGTTVSVSFPAYEARAAA